MTHVHKMERMVHRNCVSFTLLTGNSCAWQLACNYIFWAELFLFLGYLCFRQVRLHSLHQPEPSCLWTNGNVTAQVTHLFLHLLIPCCYTSSDYLFMSNTNCSGHQISKIRLVCIGLVDEWLFFFNMSRSSSTERDRAPSYRAHLAPQDTRGEANGQIKIYGL